MVEEKGRREVRYSLPSAALGVFRTMIQIKCSECGEEKPANKKHFHVNKTTKTGFQPKCKDCRRTIEKNRWKDKSEQINTTRRANYEPTGSVGGRWGKRERQRRRCLPFPDGCGRLKALIPAYWQKETRKESGWRQPCKECLGKRRKKKSLDRESES